MPDSPQTWHHGLVARWWSEFNEDGPEIAYFRILPYLRAGLDVDGCGISADMITLCREKATREGLSPTLFFQAMHELDPPRMSACTSEMNCC